MYSAFQVRLENKATIHSGIVCLNAKMITVLGGTVSSLYEEWQMNKKYSGFSRSTLKVAHEDGTAGPPPFEKLQIGALQKPLSQHKRYSGQRRHTFDLNIYICPPVILHLDFYHRALAYYL